MQNTLRIVSVFLLMIILAVPIQAQQKMITGKILADNGSPLEGITIKVKGANRHTTSDGDGSFSIQASPGETLEISYVGYQPQAIKLGSDAGLNIVLKRSDAALGEVVVTALGIKKEKRALGYAVQDIKSDELLKNKDPNVINSLNGKIAGVNITNSGGAPGSSSSIIIRGGTSLQGNNQPLFVVDGMPIDNTTGSTVDNSGFNGTLNLSTTNSNRAMDINPEDIESISVLKGPTAAALYGLRAATGAIVITTKKGADGKMTVSFNSKYIVNQVNKLPEQQNVYKQGSYYNGVFTDQTFLSWGDKFAPSDKVYDNLGDFFKTANAFDNSINVSGGSKNGNFFLSGSNLYQTGIVPTTDFVRTTFRFNGEQKVGRFTFGVTASYAKSKTSKTLTGSGLFGASGSGYMESIVTWPRNDNMKDYLNPDGTRRSLLPGIDPVNDVDNPYWIVNKNPQRDQNNRFIGTVYTNVKVTDWFDVTYKLGLDNYLTQFSSLIYPGSSVSEALQQGMLSRTDYNYNFLNHQLMLNFHKTFNDWDLNLLVGGTSEDTYSKSTGLKALKFEDPGFISIENASVQNRFYSQTLTRKRLVGVYGDARVSYKNIVYLGVTGRNDFASTLPIQNQSFFYPSYSASFVFSEILHSNVLSYGKLRASWAQVGKDAPPYQTNTYLFGPEQSIGGGFRNSWTRGNNKMKPETTTSSEIGVDLKFLKNRFGLDFTYYVNTSKDQILQPRVSNATGYILSFVNTGVIQNRGIEVTASANIIKTKHFNWNVLLNVSHNKGMVKSLPGALPILYVTDVQVGTAKAASFDNGRFLGLSGNVWKRDEGGNLILDWNTSYPQYDNSGTANVGTREPDYIGGLTNNFTYKNFSLNFLIDFRKGGAVYNGTEYLMTVYGLSKKTLNREENISLSGVSLNPATGKYEQVTRTIPATEKYYRDTYIQNSPFFIEDVNWLRLRSVMLSYSLPGQVLNSIKFVKGATVTVSGNNLILITNYSGMDPETSAAGAGVTGAGSMGVDYCGVPATRSFAVGLNFKF